MTSICYINKTEQTETAKTPMIKRHPVETMKGINDDTGVQAGRDMNEVCHSNLLSLNDYKIFQSFTSI